MPTGSLVYHETRSAVTYYSTGNFTLGVKAHFDKEVLLKSLFFKAGGAVSTSSAAKVNIYKTSDQSLVASQTLPTLSLTTGQEWEVVFTTPPVLTAGTSYTFAAYAAASQGQAFGISNNVTRTAVNTTYATTPAGANMVYDAAASWLYSGAEGYPASAYTTYDLLVGFSVDFTAPVVSNLSPSTTINNLNAVPFSWTYTSSVSRAQTQFEIGYREKYNPIWTITTGTGASASYSFPPDTFKDGIEYQWYVKAYDGANWSNPVRSTFTNNSWTTLTEVASASTTGVLNATAFTVGSYDIEVALADASGRYGDWSPLQTYALGPPSNVWVKQGGVWKQALNNVRVAGTFKQAPPTKKNTGGTF